jgi:hypothetical protein
LTIGELAIHTVPVEARRLVDLLSALRPDTTDRVKDRDGNLAGHRDVILVIIGGAWNEYPRRGYRDAVNYDPPTQLPNEVVLKARKSMSIGRITWLSSLATEIVLQPPIWKVEEDDI